MLLLALRSLFFVTILLGYSTGIWRLINDYFRREFETFLQEEAKANKYLLQDPPHPSELGGKGAGTAPTPVASSTTPLPPEVLIRAADIAAVTSPEGEPARPAGGSGLEMEHEAGEADRVAMSESDEQNWLRNCMRRPAPSDGGSEPQFCSAPMVPAHHGLPPEPGGGMVVQEAGC